jgi:hypothetical protein
MFVEIAEQQAFADGGPSFQRSRNHEHRRDIGAARPTGANTAFSDKV